MNYLRKRSIRLLLLTVVLDVLFFGLTNPAQVAPLWLMAGFILAAATVYWLIRLTLLVLALYFRGLKSQQRQLTTLLTAVATIMIGMQSMGQFSLKDFLVLIPLVLIGYFYIRYNRRSLERN
jgi:hypothetical protein